jgi:hypothetical protein
LRSSQAHSSDGLLPEALDLLTPFDHGCARYCTLASHYHTQKKYDVAAADYRKSIELGGGADGCACDPYEALVALYTVETRQYDEAWEVVHLAQRSNRRISPEVLERLRKDSGRQD